MRNFEAILENSLLRMNQKQESLNKTSQQRKCKWQHINQERTCFLIGTDHTITEKWQTCKSLV